MIIQRNRIKDEATLDILRTHDLIELVQGDWNGLCECTECYANISSHKLCESDLLADIKMIPNSKDCPGYKKR